MTQRTLSSDSIDFLKTATRRLIRAAGGVESASQATRVGKSILSDYQNPQIVDHFMPIDVVIDLERDTGGDHVTQALCRAMGGFFIRPGAAKAGGAIVHFSGHMPELGKSIGDIWAEAAKALSDGKITPCERAALISKLEDCICVMITARNSLDQGNGS